MFRSLRLIKPPLSVNKLKIIIFIIVYVTRGNHMIRKLSSGKYRLYSRAINPATGKRRNLGTFNTREAAVQHEREVQYFKRH